MGSVCERRKQRQKNIVLTSALKLGQRPTDKTDKRLYKVRGIALLQETVFATTSIGARMAYERQRLGQEDR